MSGQRNNNHRPEEPFVAAALDAELRRGLAAGGISAEQRARQLQRLRASADRLTSTVRPRSDRAWSGPALEPRRRAATSSPVHASSTPEEARMSTSTNTPLDAPVPLSGRRWPREALKIVAAAIVFGVIGAILALALRGGGDSEHTIVPAAGTPSALTSPTVSGSPTVDVTATRQAAHESLTAAGQTATAAVPALPAAGTVAATIPVGAAPMALVGGAGAIWVPNSNAGTVSRIDPATNQVVATIAIGTPPGAGKVSPGGVVMLGEQVWVSDDADASIVRIDPSTNQIVDTIVIPDLAPFAMRGLAAGAGSLWISNEYVSLIRVDPVNHAVIATVQVGAFGLAASDDALWVAAFFDGSVVRIDPVTNQIVATIQVGAGPSQIAVGAGSVWVTNQNDGSVSRIDPATNAVVTIPLGVIAKPYAIAVDASGVWVGGGGDGGLCRIDPATNQVVAAALPSGAVDGIVASDGSLWVSDNAAGSVLRIDPTP